MKEKINDWRPEVKSLLQRLIDAGCEIVKGNNGEEEFLATIPAEQFVDNLIACDESHLFVRINGKTRWLFLVLGNNPGELVSDYIVDDVLDKVTDAHYAEWELKGQPMRYVER